VASTNDLSAVVEAVGVIQTALQKLTAEQQSAVWDLINRFSSGGAPAGQGHGRGTGGGHASSGPQGKTGTGIKAFIVSKKPASDVQKLTCLAVYLARERDTQHFTTKIIREAATEAAIRFSNISVTIMNATRQNNYLVSASKGQHQVTARGEAVVDALPDQAKVKEAHDAHPFKKGRGAKKRRNAKKG
jgi:hypothetical protein